MEEDILFKNRTLYNNKMIEFLQKTVDFNQEYLKILQSKRDELINQKNSMEKK